MDKSYMMGVNINPIGLYNHWSPLQDFSSTQLANLSDELPVPNRTELVFTNKYNPDKPGISKIPIEISQEESPLNKYVSDYFNSIEIHDRITRLQAIINILNYINENSRFVVNPELVNNPNFTRLINQLNKHNLHQLTNEESQNIIARNIRKVSTDSRNMISAYSSIDDAMSLFKDSLKKLYKDKDYKDLFDGFSKYQIQESNSDGKQTVGIMANGIKVFFALTLYFNLYYKEHRNENTPQFFRKLTINGKTYIAGTIADSKIPKETISALAETLQLIAPEEVALGLKMMHTNDDASLVISSLISLATDNAKELALAKMNATIDLASMHIFLSILGFSPQDIVVYTTSPLFKQLAMLLKKNIYLNLRARINNNLWKDLGKWCQNNKIPQAELIQLKQIYDSALELKDFASLLSINQGVKNDQQKAADYMNKFSNILSKRILPLMQDDKMTKLPKVIDRESNSINLDNPLAIERLALITGMKLSDTWKDSIFLKVADLNRRIQELNIVLGERIDMQRYFADENYRKTIVDLYNLVKMNFNTYDVINHSPNFYNMISSFNMAMHKFTSMSSKANFVLKEAYDLYDPTIMANTYSDMLEDGTEVTKLLYDVSPEYNSRLMNRALRFVDDYVISDFLTSPFIKNNFPINITTFGTSGKNYNVTFLDNNSLKDFKELMNYVIIPQLKKKYPSNTFLNSIMLKDVNRRRSGDRDMRWVFKFNVDQLNSNYDILKYNDIVGGFNELLDENISLKDIFPEEGEVIVNEGLYLKFQDLLYLYNTIFNLDQFGQNSLSLLFDKYIEESNLDSVPMNLIKNYTAFDKKEKEFKPSDHAFMFYLYKNATNADIRFTDDGVSYPKDTILANLDTVSIDNSAFINSEKLLTAMRNRLLTIENISCE